MVAYKGSNSMIRSNIVRFIFSCIETKISKVNFNKNKGSFTPCLKAEASTEAHEASAEYVPETLGRSLGTSRGALRPSHRWRCRVARVLAPAEAGRTLVPLRSRPPYRALGETVLETTLDLPVAFAGLGVVETGGRRVGFSCSCRGCASHVVQMRSLYSCFIHIKKLIKNNINF